jgi:hypothetical protein
VKVPIGWRRVQAGVSFKWGDKLWDATKRGFRRVGKYFCEGDYVTTGETCIRRVRKKVKA